MHLVVCYDLDDDNNRSRLRRALSRWLTRVQYSVFEGDIHPRKLAALQREIQRHMDPGSDTVRIYLLCGACQKSTILLGTARPVLAPGSPRMF